MPLTSAGSIYKRKLASEKLSVLNSGILKITTTARSTGNLSKKMSTVSLHIPPVARDNQEVTPPWTGPFKVLDKLSVRN